MKLITELAWEYSGRNTMMQVEQSTEINEATGKKTMFIEGIYMQGGIKNRNGRLYPVSVLAKEVARYTKSYINENRAYGELGHPEGPTINAHLASHRIVELHQEGDDFVGKARVMPTPMGDIVRGILEDGGALGVSSRGMGSLKRNKSTGIMEVQDDFMLATAGDVVVDPSAPKAFVKGIMEGAEWVYNAATNEFALAVIDEVKAAGDKNVKRLDEALALRTFAQFLKHV